MNIFTVPLPRSLSSVSPSSSSGLTRGSSMTCGVASLMSLRRFVTLDPRVKPEDDEVVVPSDDKNCETRFFGAIQ